jgi:hypothetical protein
MRNEKTNSVKKKLSITNSKIINHQPWVIKHPSTLIIFDFLSFCSSLLHGQSLDGCFQSTTTKKQPHPKQITPELPLVLLRLPKQEQYKAH